MAAGGYVRLHRQIQDHWVWSSGDTARGWMDLVMLAAWEPHTVTIKGQLYTLERGDLVAAVRFLASRWRWGLGKTASFLARLQADEMLVKKRNGSGNGSPSVFHVVNYDTYQSNDVEERNGSRNAGGTVAERLRNETKKGKKGNKEASPSTPSWTDYLQTLDAAGREVLGQIAEAVASTRKIGRVKASVLDALAGQLSRYPVQAVLSGARIYRDRGCAADGKREAYLLGIVREEVRRVSLNGNDPHPSVPAKTEGQALIDHVARQMGAERQGR
jgi:hypothetical protein